MFRCSGHENDSPVPPIDTCWSPGFDDVSVPRDPMLSLSSSPSVDVVMEPGSGPSVHAHSRLRLRRPATGVSGHLSEPSSSSLSSSEDESRFEPVGVDGERGMDVRGLLVRVFREFGRRGRRRDGEDGDNIGLRGEIVVSWREWDCAWVVR
jgi:hypothetical protein